MANIVELRDSGNVKSYPVTKAEAVYMSDNSTVEAGFTKLSDTLDYQSDIVYTSTTFADTAFRLGQITTTGGTDDSSTIFCRTSSYIRALKGSTFGVDDETTYRFNVAVYTGTSTDTFVSIRGASEFGEFVMPIDGYVRSCIGYKSGATLSDTSIKSHYITKIFTDSIRSEINAANDVLETISLSNTDILVDGLAISTDTGGLYYNTKSIATRVFTKAMKGSWIEIPDSSELVIAYYNSNTQDSFTHSVLTSASKYFITEDAYIRFALSYEGGADPDSNLKNGTTIRVYPYNLSDKVNIIEESTTDSRGNGISFVIGALEGTTGNDVALDTRCRSGFYPAKDGSTVRLVNNGAGVYQFAVFEYGSNTTMYYFGNQSALTWVKNEYVVSNKDVGSVRVVAKRKDNATITDADIAYFEKNIYITPTFSDRAKISIEPIPDETYITDSVTYDSTSDMTYNQIISGYDALVTDFPEYVTKRELGTDQSGDYVVYQYIFAPKLTTKLTYNYGGTTYNTSASELPTIILEAGVHGGERPIVKGLLNAMTAICRNWRDNKVLAFLRMNFRFVVNPCAVPWGYVQGGRFNSRQVNINRNFNGMDQWQFGSSTVGDANYRGESPLSEKESQYIHATLEEFSNAILYYSFHTYGMKDAYSHMMCWAWGTYVNSNEMYIIGESILKKISRNAWIEHDYPYTDGTMLGCMQILNGVTLGADYRGGYTANEGNAFGIPSACPEGIYHVYNQESTSNSHDINCINAEYVIMCVMEALKRLY